jgi:uncharacterized protein (TIGR02996 family)
MTLLEGCNFGRQKCDSMATITEEAFLRRILADPHDRALRLIYADWLEERGDARADLIRLEEEMATLPVWSDRYAALKPRRNVLRERIDLRWRETLGYVPKHRPMFAALPKRREERWRLFEEFLEIWYRPRTRDDGFSDTQLLQAERKLGLPLPVSLREWYQLAGKSRGYWQRHDHLTSPSELSVDRATDCLIFYGENQWCAAWGFRISDLSQEDPPVFRLDSGAPELQSEALTTFALRSVAYEACISWPNSGGVIFAGECVSEICQAEIKKRLTCCDFSRSSPECDRFRIFEGDNLILFESIDFGDDAFIFGSARTRAAYEALGEAVLRELQENTSTPL